MVPSGRPVHHVVNDEVIIEHEVCLDLIIKRLGKINVGNVGRLWLGPTSADSACVNNRGDVTKYNTWHSDSL